MKKSLLSGAALLGLAMAVPQGGAIAQELGQMEWFGSVYVKMLDGNERSQNGLFNNNEFGAGDQGQGIEFELMFRNQVSRQVEVGGRLQSRFYENYWSNFGGFGDDEKDPRRNQYVKLRGAYVRLTPGYEWVDSVLIGNSDFGLWDALTLGKLRYIDRDNAGGIIAQGSGGNVKWDVARMSLPKLWAGPSFKTGDFYAQDAAYVGQVKLAATPELNLNAIALFVNDDEVDPADRDIRNGRDTIDRYSNQVYALKAQFAGLEGVDLSASAYYSNLDINGDVAGCASNATGANACRWTPLLNRDADDWSYFVNLELGEILAPNLTLSAQLFHIGSDYTSILAARREQDVLLTEGREGAWAWSRPNYNTGDPSDGSAISGVGYGGWNGHMDQVVSLNADNDFTDFDERAAESVIGWRGLTVVPRYTSGDLELQGEVSYVDFDTNWQACGGVSMDTACVKYPRLDGTHSWGVGGDWRSVYAPYQDKHLWISAINANYLADVGTGLQLAARLKYVRDEDKRVTSQAGLADAYGTAVTDVSDDDRKADYWTAGASAGYQLTQDLFGRLVYEYQYVDLVDGTVNVTPPGAESWEVPFGWVEYMTGEHSKNKVALQGSYFLSGVEIGADVQYIWGTYSPEFRAGAGQTLRNGPGNTVVTAFGNISRDNVEFDVYRLKVFTKVQF